MLSVVALEVVHGSGAGALRRLGCSSQLRPARPRCVCLARPAAPRPARRPARPGRTKISRTTLLRRRGDTGTAFAFRLEVRIMILSAVCFKRLHGMLFLAGLRRAAPDCVREVRPALGPVGAAQGRAVAPVFGRVPGPWRWRGPARAGMGEQRGQPGLLPLWLMTKCVARNRSGPAAPAGLLPPEPASHPCQALPASQSGLPSIGPFIHTARGRRAGRARLGGASRSSAPSA